VKTRRGPWLSGLIAALLGAAWMIGQVLGGVVSLITDALSVDMSEPAATIPLPAASGPPQFDSAATALNQPTVRGLR
jgi:hypothetical protein